jgi:hypothetical protein
MRNPRGQLKTNDSTSRENRETLEDINDLTIIAERKEELSQPFEILKERLEHKLQNKTSNVT